MRKELLQYRFQKNANMHVASRDVLIPLIMVRRNDRQILSRVKNFKFIRIKGGELKIREF